MKKLVIKKNLNNGIKEASKYLTTYYGQLSHLKIKPNETFELNQQQKISDEYRKYFYKNDLVKISYLLVNLKKANIQKVF